MKIAVHYNDHLHEASFAFGWIKELEKRGVEVLKVDFYSNDIIDKVRDCDGAMWNWFHLPLDKITAPHVLYTIENVIGIPTFPNIDTRWHFEVAQHYFFSARNYPSIKSWVFHSYDDAISFANDSDYPLVFKLSVGASSSNITKIENKNEAINIINKIFGEGIEPDKSNLDQLKKGRKELLFRSFLEKSDKPKYPLIQKEYVYFQEYLPENNFDIRVNVIGERIFAFVRHNRDNDFRASGSGKIDYNKDLIPQDVLKLAYRVSKENNFQSMAYDFLKNSKEEYLINEISYSYRSKPVEDCNGYWDKDLNFINKRISPEEAIVEDFINYINLNKLLR